MPTAVHRSRFRPNEHIIFTAVSFGDKWPAWFASMKNRRGSRRWEYMAEYRRRRDNKLYQNYGIGIVLFQINLFKKKLLCVTNYSCIKLACLFVDKRLQKKNK